MYETSKKWKQNILIFYIKGHNKNKKKTPKGTYKIQVFTTENAKYKKATLNITITVK